MPNKLVYIFSDNSVIVSLTDMKPLDNLMNDNAIKGVLLEQEGHYVCVKSIEKFPKYISQKIYDVSAFVISYVHTKK